MLLGISCFSPVYSRSVEKQTVLAVLTLNVARFTTWPEQVFNADTPVLNLCVLGDNVVQQAFANIDNKKVNTKTIHISILSRLRNLSECQLLYISELEQNILLQVLLELKGLPILTVGENLDFIKAGGMIGLEKVKGKIQMSVNLPIIKQSELVMSSRILKLAKIYDYPYPAH